MKKSIAQKTNHDFDIGLFRIFDDNNNEIYYEDSSGFWIKREFDKNGNKTYFEDSSGFWVKYKYTNRNILIHSEILYGFKEK